MSMLRGGTAVSFALLDETSVPSDINGMDPDVVVSTRPFRNIGLSKAAQTHRLRKLRTPSKCRECDSYVYFQGAECEEVRRRPRSDASPQPPYALTSLERLSPPPSSPGSVSWPVTSAAWSLWLSSAATRSCRAACSSSAGSSAR